MEVSCRRLRTGWGSKSAFALPMLRLMSHGVLDRVRQAALIQSMWFEHCPQEGPHAAAGEPVQKLPLLIRSGTKLQPPWADRSILTGLQGPKAEHQVRVLEHLHKLLCMSGHQRHADWSLGADHQLFGFGIPFQERPIPFSVDQLTLH